MRSEAFSQDIIKVGKLPSQDLRIEDDNVSRMHAVVEVKTPSEVNIIDLGSAAGTIVNGQKVNKCQLHDGDELLLGDTQILVAIGEASVAAMQAQPMPDAFARAAAGASGPDPLRGSALPDAPAAAQPGPAMPAPSLGAQPLAAPGTPGPGALAAPATSAAPGQAAAAVNPFAAGNADLPNPFAAKPSPFAAPVAAPSEGDVKWGLATNGPPVDPRDVETGTPAVEVSVMWGETVLEVQHLSPPRTFSVGGEGADFVLPNEALGIGRLPVVLATPSGAAAVVIPAEATGEVVHQGQTWGWLDLKGQGQLQPCAELAGALQFTLPPDATATVEYRGFTFTVKATPAGRVLGAGFSVDWKSHTWTAVSFALHLAVLLMFYFLPPASSVLSLDLLSQDSRLIEYLMEPPETEEEEAPDYLNEAQDNEGGTGERHREDEGQMGEEQSEKNNNRFAIEGPADADPEMAREQAREQAANVATIGVLAAMTGSWNSPTSPFGGEQAVGNDPMSAMGALMGDQIGSNFGFGGLGLRGTGRGGGGTGEGTIGLGSLGTIGHGSGSGSGSGYGRGAGGLSNRRARVPRIRTGSAEVRGSLSREVIRRVIRRHLNEVKFCYEQQLNQRPDLEGRVQVTFIISTTGAVQSAAVNRSTLGNRDVEGCIVQAVRRWTFPAPEGGGVVGVNYPFVLSSSG